jgi:hypothetical protein
MVGHPGLARVRSSPRAAWWLLVVFEVLVAVNAVYGGIGLMVNGMGMPQDWLDGTPFGSWVLPGLLLLLLVAAPMASAAIVEVVIGGRRAYEASMIAGAVLIGWIGAQVMILRRFFFLQPILFAVGVLVVLLARLVHHRRSAAADPDTKAGPS